MYRFCDCPVPYMLRISVMCVWRMAEEAGGPLRRRVHLPVLPVGRGGAEWRGRQPAQGVVSGDGAVCCNHVWTQGGYVAVHRSHCTGIGGERNRLCPQGHGQIEHCLLLNHW